MRGLLGGSLSSAMILRLDPVRARQASMALMSATLLLAAVLIRWVGDAPSAQAAGRLADPSPAAHAPSVPPAADTPAPPAPAAHAEPRVRRVLIVSFDGLRPDAIRHAYAPNIEWLRTNGAFSWRALTIRRASTLPAHASMLTGVDADRHGLVWNRYAPELGYTRFPTIFSIARAAGIKTAMFVGKPKFRHIVPPGTVDLFEHPGYLCPHVAREAADYLSRASAGSLTFVHFSDPDDRGHANGWMSARQMGAVRTADQCLGHLLGALRRAGTMQSTLVILSSDHGGHATRHSGSTESDRLIPWIAFGPDVRQAYEIRTPVSTMDTAATVLYALGLPPPAGLVGVPVREIFQHEEPLPEEWASRLLGPRSTPAGP